MPALGRVFSRVSRWGRIERSLICHELESNDSMKMGKLVKKNTKKEVRIVCVKWAERSKWNFR